MAQVLMLCLNSQWRYSEIRKIMCSLVSGWSRPLLQIPSLLVESSCTQADAEVRSQPSGSIWSP